MKTTVKSAPALRRGDTIGLAPVAGPWQEDKFVRGVGILAEFGFKVKTPARKQYNYLAGSDRFRLNTLHELWRDPEVKAVMAIRGGYGCLRLLERLNFNLIRQNPKILVGFSDVTVLLTAIWQQTGLVTFHGPMLTTLEITDKDSRRDLFKRLTEPEPYTLRPDNIRILRKGTAHGRLVGGNLTTISHLLATPAEPVLKNNIFFIEDVGEAPYRIDRMLTQLMMSGRFNTVSGLILGNFSNCGETKLIRQRVLELLPAHIPVWADFPVGHTSSNRTLPVGVMATMDEDSGSLRFGEPYLLP